MNRLYSMRACRFQLVLGALGLCAGAITSPVFGDNPPGVAVVVDATAGSDVAQDNLEPEVLDFRYRPSRAQVCIGLPDDPFKSIVGSDGGLYYDYGQRGPQLYANGQGQFGTRFLVRMPSDVPAGPIVQNLVDARTPIVVTRQQVGSLRIEQRAWAATDYALPADWATKRVDYLWIKVVNEASVSKNAKLVLDVGTPGSLELDASRTKLYRTTPPRRLMCELSAPCMPDATVAAKRRAKDELVAKSENAISVSRDWARPRVPCAACFQHVMVGYGQPLRFTIDHAKAIRYRVFLGVIEGWHKEAGIRPIVIRVDGQPPTTLDLVKKPGQNMPFVYSAAIEDQDRDGRLQVSVDAAAGASDRNTILSGLWLYPDQQAPTTDQVLRGKTTAKPLLRIDADHLPQTPAPKTLAWSIADLVPGKTWQLLVAIPQDAGAATTLRLGNAAKAYQQAIDFWHSAPLPYDRFVVPDPAIQRLLDGCIRNIYQAREIKDGKPAFQVGPTCYRGTWAADGPFILEAITYLGRWRETRAGLEAQIDGDTGPGGVAFSKKSGLRLWMILRHAQLTQDDDWLRTMWPRVVREVDQIIAYRDITRNDPRQANYGLMPIGFGDGGLGGKHREYTNVYWTLAGLNAALTIARRLHAPELDKWQAEYRDYWAAFEKARQRDQLQDAAGNSYVPVTMKGEAPQLPQRGAWAFLQSIFPGRIFDQNDALMRGTMAMLDANQQEGLIYGTGWIPDGIWNYAASFYAHAHLWLGHGRKAAATLYAFGNHASPLLCWREEQNVRGAPEHFVGDMPHNWASAEFIRLVRHLILLERKDTLHVFAGLPRTWVHPNARLCLRDVPTTFGPTTVQMTIDAGGTNAKVKIDLPRTTALKRVHIHLESMRAGRAQLDEDDVRSLPIAGHCRGHIELSVPLS